MKINTEEQILWFMNELKDANKEIRIRFIKEIKDAKERLRTLEITYHQTPKKEMVETEDNIDNIDEIEKEAYEELNKIQ